MNRNHSVGLNTIAVGDRMGLDQYLETESGEELIYWRKANHINKWFNDKVAEVKNVEKIEVTKDQLIQLKEDCLTVLNDKSKAKELLPTQDGFFFGSTEYDEWYFNDLQYTVNHIDNVLDMMEDRDFGKMYYFAWW